jgi:class 3 adenylate cyclase
MKSLGLVATQTLTFLFTDIEGSTAMVRRLGDAWPAVLADHHRLIRAAFAAHGGEEVVTQGDGVFAVFTSPRACVDAAIQMQRELVSHAWPAGESVRVRMGIHSGEATQTAAGLAGLEVHRAARIAAVAHGGQVTVSAAATGDFVLKGWKITDTALLAEAAPDHREVVMRFPARMAQFFQEVAGARRGPAV